MEEFGASGSIKIMLKSGKGDKVMRRKISLLLVVVMVLSLFAGCGKKEGSNGDGKRETLVVGIPRNGYVEDYETNALTLYLEELLNVNLKFELFAGAAAEYTQQLSMMSSSGEKFPDVLWGFNNLGRYIVNEYGEDGFFADLNPLIEKYAPNYKAAMEKLSEAERKVIIERGTSVKTGGFYGMPYYSNLQIADYMQSMIVINQKWLDAVNMKAPTNIDELYDVLVAFKTKDPNGNGKADEVPMLGANAMLWVVNAFVYFGNDLNVTDGKVWDPVVTDEYRQAMVYLKKLCEEDLFSELSFTASAADTRKLISGEGTTARVGIWCGHPETTTSVNCDILDQYTALGTLADETGKGGYGVQNPATIIYSGFISESCKNKELAMKFLDAFYMDETTTRVRHGEKGTDWKVASEPQPNAFNGMSTIEIVNPDAFFSGNRTYSSNGPSIATPENYLAIAVKGKGRYAESARLLNEMTNSMLAFKKPAEVAVNLVYNLDEYTERSDISASRGSYISQTRSKFITGDMDISDNKVWKEYLDTLDKYREKRYVEIVQSAYDRQK